MGPRQELQVGSPDYGEVMINIYKITRKDRTDYDEFQSVVIAAASEQDALKFLPCGCEHEAEPIRDEWGCVAKQCPECFTHDWIYKYWQPDNLIVTHIGLALPGVTGVIDFNFIRS